ncbi:MAG: type II toxin-antitoxin system VapC family toxin [Candidatus Poribacteria bacterium]|nr:type II toxin-antitoxin system VapC family toxin [Candidatus Poribacteria bacterium]
MIEVFVIDSSALVKGYVEETGSEWVRALLNRSTDVPIYIAHITIVETVAAIARCSRPGDIPRDEAEKAITTFMTEGAGRLRGIDVDYGVILRAAGLASKHVIRGYDAVQLAVALGVRQAFQESETGSVALVSSGGELNAAARAEGLVVIDPTDMPRDGQAPDVRSE